MPTPLAHAGFALAAALLGRVDPGARHGRREVLALVVLANLADVDFVPGLVTGDAVAFHHGLTHSVLFALLAGAATARLAGIERRLAVVVALSHPVLDWLTGEPGADVARYGVALWWPWPARYMCDVHVFGAYHIDTMGLVGGVLTAGALGPLAREVAFVAACLGVAAAGRALSKPPVRGA